MELKEPLRTILESNTASKHFREMKENGELEKVFPEVHALIGVEQNEHHPEGDAFEHTMLVVEQAKDNLGRLLALCHDMGKAVTEAPSHYGHEKKGLPIVEEFCRKWEIHPQMPMIATEFHTHIHRIYDMRTNRILKLFHMIEAFDKPFIPHYLAELAENDHRGRKGYENSEYPNMRFFLTLFHAALEAKTDTILRMFDDPWGFELPDETEALNELYNARLNEMKRARKEIENDGS